MHPPRFCGFLLGGRAFITLIGPRERHIRNIKDSQRRKPVPAVPAAGAAVFDATAESKV